MTHPDHELLLDATKAYWNLPEPRTESEEDWCSGYVFGAKSQQAEIARLRAALNRVSKQVTQGDSRDTVIRTIRTALGDGR